MPGRRAGHEHVLVLHVVGHGLRAYGLACAAVALDPSAALLTDRVAIVTGAAVGIGEAVAKTFARFGAHVAICDRDVPNLDETADAIERAGRRAVAAELDVRDGDAVAAFVDTVASELGHVDVLVNNAGGGFYAAFLDVNDKGQDSLMRENFTSVTNFTGRRARWSRSAAARSSTSRRSRRTAPRRASRCTRR